MANTEQMTISHETTSLEGMHPVNGYTEITQMVVRARIRAREVEAAGERLAAIARTTTTSNGNARRRVGRLLILAGRRIAGESVPSGSPAARPTRPMAA